MAEEKALGLQGTKRIEIIQMGLARAVDIQNSTGNPIYLCKTKNKQETKNSHERRFQQSGQTQDLLARKIA